MGALVALAMRLLAGGPVRAIGTGVVGGELLGPFLPSFGFGGDDEKKHRHRRRKMFTNTDIAQFAAAESIAGKSAARALMMIRAAKA